MAILVLSLLLAITFLGEWPVFVIRGKEQDDCRSRNTKNIHPSIFFRQENVNQKYESHPVKSCFTKNYYLFLCEVRQTYNNQKFRSFWYFIKLFFFLHKEGSRSRLRGSRFVWVIMCVRPTLGYLHRIHLSHLTSKVLI